MEIPSFQSGFLDIEDGAATPHVTFGCGANAIIVVPGAADGLRTCVEVAVYLAWFYRERARTNRVVILSRRDPIPAKFNAECHADDMIRAVEGLGLGPSVWECLSAAGPIGQQVAVKRPDLVRGLILSSAFDHVSDRTRKVLGKWLDLAQHPTGIDAFSGMFEQKYSPPPEVATQIPIEQLPRPTHPRSPDRLVRILEELVLVDQRAIMPRLACPTLVIGGEDDRTVPAVVQREMATRIPNCELELYPGFGHFNDMENPDYERRVQMFAGACYEGSSIASLSRL